MIGKKERKTGELPDILRRGKIFRALLEPPRVEHKQFTTVFTKRLYELTTKLLPAEYRGKSNTYYKWYSNPERSVNRAFLVNKQKNEQKWLTVVDAMEAAMVMTLREGVTQMWEQVRRYADKHEELEAYLDSYLKTNQIPIDYEEKDL